MEFRFRGTWGDVEAIIRTPERLAGRERSAEREEEGRGTERQEREREE